MLTCMQVFPLRASNFLSFGLNLYPESNDHLYKNQVTLKPHHVPGLGQPQKIL
jgi:hypothetical protein